MGILICGLNGTGKSTLGRILADRMGYEFIDNEDLYFPKTDPSYVFSGPRSKEEAIRLLEERISGNKRFIFAAVKGDYGDKLGASLDGIVLIEAPKQIRSRRVRERSYQKFGDRILPGGDLYDKESQWFSLTDSRPDTYVTDWLETVRCPVIRIDGTRPVEENAEYLVSVFSKEAGKAYYHLPGLFEFYELYRRFLPLFREHREYFYDWCDIGSIYGAPADCLWGGGRVGFGEEQPEKVAEMMREYAVSAHLTFSNSLLREEHLSDRKCNALCALFERSGTVRNGVIISSDLLLDYLRKQYPGFCFVASTTKVLTDFGQLEDELNRREFRYVVPDFRLNKAMDRLKALPEELKQKVEFLCNECCWYDCYDRKACYENVSRKNLGESCEDHVCVSPEADKGYRFSEAMRNPGFISIRDIQDIYLPNGFSHFKIEGRSLGSAVILEFLLYYMTKPEYQLKVREEIYLDSNLDLF